MTPEQTGALACALAVARRFSDKEIKHLREQLRGIENAKGRLEHLADSGARHMGGHRSGKRWKDDILSPALGYWVD